MPTIIIQCDVAVARELKMRFEQHLRENMNSGNDRFGINSKNKPIHMIKIDTDNEKFIHSLYEYADQTNMAAKKSSEKMIILPPKASLGIGLSNKEMTAKMDAEEDLYWRSHDNAPIFRSGNNKFSLWTHLVQGDYSTSPYISIQSLDLSLNANTATWGVIGDFGSRLLNSNNRFVTIIDMNVIRNIYQNNFLRSTTEVNEKLNNKFLLFNGYEINGAPHSLDTIVQSVASASGRLDTTAESVTLSQVLKMKNADPGEYLILGDVPMEAIIFVPNKEEFRGAAKDGTLAKFIIDARAEAPIDFNGYAIRVVGGSAAIPADILKTLSPPTQHVINTALAAATISHTRANRGHQLQNSFVGIIEILKNFLIKPTSSTNSNSTFISKVGRFLESRFFRAEIMNHNPQGIIPHEPTVTLAHIQQPTPVASTSAGSGGSEAIVDTKNPIAHTHAHGKRKNDGSHSHSSAADGSATATATSPKHHHHHSSHHSSHHHTLRALGVNHAAHAQELHSKLVSSGGSGSSGVTVPGVRVINAPPKQQTPPPQPTPPVNASAPMQVTTVTQDPPPTLPPTPSK